MNGRLLFSCVSSRANYKWNILFNSQLCNAESHFMKAEFDDRLTVVNVGFRIIAHITC